MHNWLIFQYRCERVRTNPWLLSGCLPFGEDETTHREAVSNGVTQKGR